tara:strand:- start:959 stop:1075 length:117 start_codon:yes stop_codon:yes gene_type:complete
VKALSGQKMNTKMALNFAKHVTNFSALMGTDVPVAVQT